MKFKVAAVAIALISGLLATSSPASAGSTTIKVQCAGSDATSQGSLAIVGGAIDADIVVDHTAPETLKPGDSASVDFSFTTQITPELIDKAVTLLGVSSVNVDNLVFGVNAQGANVQQTAKGGPFSIAIPVSTGSGLKLTNGPFNLSYSNVTSGVISYRFAPIQMSVVIGAISVNVICSPIGSNVIAKTVVRDPDAPVAGNATLNVGSGQGFSTDLASVVVPGKTPIIPGSYKLLDGNGVLAGSTLTGTAPVDPGTTTLTYEVCAEPKPESNQPGVNESIVADFSIPEPNERPVAFSLKVGDVETPLIWTTKAKPAFQWFGAWVTPPLPKSNGSQDKTEMNDWGEYLFWSDFKAPEASQLQNAFTAAGFETSVTGAFPSFVIEFVGKDAGKDISEVTVGRWLTTLPYQFFLDIKDVVASMSDTGGGTPAPLLTDGEIWGLILAGHSNEAGEAFKNRLLNGLKEAAPALLEGLVNSFYQPPRLATVNGEPPVQAQPLCSQGQVDVVVAAPDVVSTATAAGVPDALFGDVSGADGSASGVNKSTTGSPIAFTG